MNLDRHRYRQVLRMQRMMAEWCEHTVTVRRIGDGYNIRVFLNGVLNQEARTLEKRYIGYTIASMLRMECKCGNWSDMAEASRRRMSTKPR